MAGTGSKAVLRAGNPEWFGARKAEGGVNFTIAVPDDLDAKLILTDAKGQPVESIDLPPEERIGEVSSVFVETPAASGYYYLIGGKKAMDPGAEVIEDGFCRWIANPSGWEDASPAFIPPEDLIIYKLHVRGFTRQLRSGVRHKGTFAGVAEKADYIASLGFSAVELMPVYEWDETLRLQPFAHASEDPDGHAKTERMRNYWGYAEKNRYFAPKRAFASSDDPVREMRGMVHAFHIRGMEVFMEMYFPAGTDPCLALQAVRHWKTRYHIDGFHLIGCGVPKDGLVRDPLLKRTKILLDQFDAGRIYGQTVPKHRYLMEYNDWFETRARSFLKSDGGQVSDFSWCLRRNPPTHGVVNYIANVNGFTLFDLVSYNEKHNEANGENNQDGTDANFSWNCGAEGPTRKKNVQSLRMKQMKNALAGLFLAQGTPLLMAGDEMLNTQGGNNNAYASDNPTGWTDWRSGRGVEEIRETVRFLVHFRKEHRIFHMRHELRGSDYRSLGAPDISFHDSRAWIGAFEYGSRTLGVMYNAWYAGQEHQQEEACYYVCFNAYWEPHEFALPDLPRDFAWSRLFSTCGSLPEADGDALPEEQKTVTVPERSVTLFAGRRLPEELLAKRALEKRAASRKKGRSAVRRKGEEAGLPAEPVREHGSGTDPDKVPADGPEIHTDRERGGIR